MDEYIVKKCSYGDGVYFYYKNGKLHREEGPAIVSSYNIARIKSKKFNDDHLYKEEILKTMEPDGHTNISIIDDTVCPPLIQAVYYLEGKPYTKKQFEEIKTKLDLKKELDKELDMTKTNSKKVKV